jgi:hypothetical protein
VCRPMAELIVPFDSLTQIEAAKPPPSVSDEPEHNSAVGTPVPRQNLSRAGRARNACPAEPSEEFVTASREDLQAKPRRM